MVNIVSGLGVSLPPRIRRMQSLLRIPTAAVSHRQVTAYSCTAAYSCCRTAAYSCCRTAAYSCYPQQQRLHRLACPVPWHSCQPCEIHLSARNPAVDANSWPASPPPRIRTPRPPRVRLTGRRGFAPQAEAGDALANSAAIDMVSFTGSIPTGSKIMAVR